MQINKDDLESITEGLNAIEEAALGMFGLKKGSLFLEMDKFDILATYTSNRWDLDINEKNEEKNGAANSG